MVVLGLSLLSLSLAQTSAEPAPAAQNTTEPAVVTEPAVDPAAEPTPTTQNTTEPAVVPEPEPAPTTQNTTEPAAVPEAALVCPKYQCLRTVSSSCVAQTLDGWSISECPAGSECKFSFASMNTSSCQIEVENEFEVEPTCYAGYVLANQPCNSSDYCVLGHFCDAVSLTCKPRARLGSVCSQSNECEANAVCNQGLCVAHFSVPAGGASSSSVACASGIVLNETCQAAQLTNGTFPKTCSRDGDCLALDGLTAGVCQCGANLQGLAYCSAHRSDKLSLKQLASAHNGNYDEIRYHTYKLLNFHVVMGEIVRQPVEDCLDEALDIEAFEDLKELFELCSSSCLNRAACAAELGF